MFVFFKQKTAYEMRISDWSSDVCSSDLGGDALDVLLRHARRRLVEQQQLGLQRQGGGDLQGPLAAVRQLAGRRLGKGGEADLEIGRASCRERVCQYV